MNKILFLLISIFLILIILYSFLNKQAELSHGTSPHTSDWFVVEDTFGASSPFSGAWYDSSTTTTPYGVLTGAPLSAQPIYLPQIIGCGSFGNGTSCNFSPNNPLNSSQTSALANILGLSTSQIDLIVSENYTDPNYPTLGSINWNIANGVNGLNPMNFIGFSNSCWDPSSSSCNNVGIVETTNTPCIDLVSNSTTATVTSACTSGNANAGAAALSAYIAPKGEIATFFQNGNIAGSTIPEVAFPSSPTTALPTTAPPTKSPPPTTPPPTPEPTTPAPIFYSHPDFIHQGLFDELSIDSVIGSSQSALTKNLPLQKFGMTKNPIFKKFETSNTLTPVKENSKPSLLDKDSILQKFASDKTLDLSEYIKMDKKPSKPLKKSPIFIDYNSALKLLNEEEKRLNKQKDSKSKNRFIKLHDTGSIVII